jgi:hypothetical protein
MSYLLTEGRSPTGDEIKEPKDYEVGLIGKEPLEKATTRNYLYEGGQPWGKTGC